MGLCTRLFTENIEKYLYGKRFYDFKLRMFDEFLPKR